MLKSNRMLAVLALLLVFLGVSSGLSRGSLLASTYPVYYPLKHMAEGRFEVDLLIKTQADPHHYEIKPEDLRKLQRANAFFYLGVEKWERQVAGKVSKAIPLHRGIRFLKAGRHDDPHIWLSPIAYRALVENLMGALINLDPAGEEQYRKRGEEFLKNLRLLEEEYRKVLSTCQDRVLVTTHLSTAYLGRDYGLEVVGLRGVHAEEEPKPSEIRKMVEKVKKAGVKTLFHEKGHEEKLAGKLAREIGAKVLPLNTSLFPEEKGDDYFSIMRRNLHRLAEGLRCQTR